MIVSCVNNASVLFVFSGFEDLVFVGEVAVNGRIVRREHDGTTLGSV